MLFITLLCMGKESGEQAPEALQAEAQRILAEIKQFRAQAQEQFELAETARKNADSEGLFAVNAKRTCEEHATAISQLKGAAEAEVNSIVTNKQKVEELASGLVAGKPVAEGQMAFIAETAKVVAEHGKIIETSTAAILETTERAAALARDIAASKKTTEALTQETKELKDEAFVTQGRANGWRTEAGESAEQASELLEKTTAAHALSVATAKKIEAVLTTSNADKDAIADVLKRLKESFDITMVFETDLDKSKKALDALIVKADGLLPGFTSVSLASAFGNHKKRFMLPKITWISTFVGCMGGLVAVALPSFLAAISHDTKSLPPWEDIARGFAMRLPIVIPLIWLGIYAGRNYMLSIRLEEDYAYKEAISKAFEGYKREMKEIGPIDAANPAPLTTLCTNVLSAIAERPGRIYDGKHQNFTIMTEAQGAVEKADELRKKVIAGAS